MRWHNTATERHQIQNLSQELMPLCLSDSMTGMKKLTQKYSSKNVSYKERTENEYLKALNALLNLVPPGPSSTFKAFQDCNDVKHSM